MIEYLTPDMRVHVSVCVYVYVLTDRLSDDTMAMPDMLMLGVGRSTSAKLVG